jgi:hypothetical protein
MNLSNEILDLDEQIFQLFGKQCLRKAVQLYMQQMTELRNDNTLMCPENNDPEAISARKHIKDFGTINHFINWLASIK